MTRRELFGGLGATIAAIATAAKVVGDNKERVVTLPPAYAVATGEIIRVTNLWPHETVTIMSDGRSWHVV